MARATVPNRTVNVISKGSEKRFFSVRDSQAALGSQDLDAILRIRWNPYWSESQTDGTAMTAATVDVDATNIILSDQVGVERNVAHASKTIRQLVEEINALTSSRRPWIAGFADIDPGVTITPVDPGAAISAEIGYGGDSVPLNHSTTGVIWISPGFDGSAIGSDQQPDGFNTDYEYTVTTAGRAGAIRSDEGEDILPGRSNRFGTGNTILARERYPARPVFETTITSVSHTLTTAGAEDIVVEVFQDDGTLAPVWSTEMPETTNERTVPNVRTQGPAYVKMSSKSAGAFTAGSVMLTGFIRLA